MSGKKRSLTVVLAVLLAFLSFPVVCKAIQVSPEEITLTVEVPPGSEPEEFSYTIGVAGSAGETKYTASADQGWMSIDNPSGDIPGSFTVTITVSPNLLPDDGTVEGTITVTSNTGSSATVRVTIIHIIQDKLTVNPAEITLRFTRANLSPRTFTARVTNANYERNDFKWSAETSASWLSVQPATGEGESNVTVTVDPISLEAGEYEGTITFRSNLPVSNIENAEATLTVNVIVEAPNELTVFPSYLFWSVELGEDGTLESFTSQILHVYAGATGFSISYDIPWIEVSSDQGLATEQAEGIFQITPVASLLQTYGVGRYEGTIKVVDRATAFYREVPIIVEIRNPGDPVSLPVDQPTFEQIIPGYVLVRATDAHWFHAYLHVYNVDYYTTEEECENALGTWIDPFTGDTVNLGQIALPYCSENEKVYVLISVPQLHPTTIFAYVPNGTDPFIKVYENGDYVAEFDPYYSMGPIPEAYFGPVRLSGLGQQLRISVRVGKSVQNAVEVQQILVQISTLEGVWRVTEEYKGEVYTYEPSRLLTFTFDSSTQTYTGSWAGTPVSVVMGDSEGSTYLYKFYFVENGIEYEYEVTSLSTSRMEGRWRFSYGGSKSEWEHFYASRYSGSLYSLQ